MIAAVRSALTGWDAVVALLVLVGAVVLEKLVPPVPWVAWISLFLIAMFGFAITVTW